MNDVTALIDQAQDIAGERAALTRRAGCRLLKRLAEQERELRAVCSRLATEVKARGALDPKAAWLLDNFTFLQGQIREVREAIPRSYYRHLPRMQEGPYRGDPRAYRLAAEIVARSGREVDLEAAGAFLRVYQETRQLLLAELWAIGPMLTLALLEKLLDAASDPSADEGPVAEAIAALRGLETASWKDFFESISRVDALLHEDPAGSYGRFDFDTRDACRHAIEEIARTSPLSEEEITRLALEMARQAAADHDPDPRQAQVAHYLLGSGSAALKRAARYRAPLKVALRGVLYRHPNLLYLGGLSALTLGLVAAICWLLRPVPFWVPVLLLIPASQLALAVMNPLVNLLLPPRRLPRLDFSQGIPDDCRGFVVIPTLLLSKSGVEKLLERIEIHYLANRDPNLFFGLLTDLPDSTVPTAEQDQLLDVCAEGIRLLNQRYEGSPFYLFHRDREWNESEGVWMGHERKRGKLVDFNHLLLGIDDAFSVKIGDLSVLPAVRYVITLDSDTQLPRDTAYKMIATMAHPLNRPVIDPDSGIVREGFALMQPRISISMESAGRSRLAEIYSGQTGFDPYTTAVSDVYQDLHGQGSFTGKGIYDVRAFERVLGGRFPDNTLLSHDLIEGEHARVALITDLELVDDYPATYQAYSKRKHRWVRGDWQIARWILPTVPNHKGETVKNPLPAVSRWKIADNLRRSLFEITLLALLVAGWFFGHATPFRWTLITVAFLAAPAYIELGFRAVRVPPRRYWRTWAREGVFQFGRGHLDALLTLIFLPHQACLMADAIIRTVTRMLFTHRKLLEWESMAQVEEGGNKRYSVLDRYLWVPPVLAIVAGFWMPGRGWLDAFALVVLELWVVAPFVIHFLNSAGRRQTEPSAEDVAFLRETALSTWRFFNDLCGPAHNWLVPDNIQEDPPKTADKISPTNIGLLLGAHLAASDFGYLTRLELATRLEQTFATLKRMERCRGHFYNWYDTQTLQPLAPLYVSSVDSGNLAASLVLIKQACLEALRRPAVDDRLLAGLRDHCLRLRNVLPPPARTSSVTRLLSSLLRQLDYRPADLFGWESLLTETNAVARRLREHLTWAGSQLEGAQAAEVEYWQNALAARIESALAALYTLAPWLSGPPEQELRLHATDPGLKELLAELERVAPLRSLADQYAAIEDTIRIRLESRMPLQPAMRRTLEDLLAKLPVARDRAAELIRSLRQSATAANTLLRDMDFAFLFDSKRKLLRIGYDVATGKLDPSYYDLLASEARSGVFLAIAKGDVPREAWFRLGRKLAFYNGHRTLYSWSGTLFEYLMPCLFMRTWDATLLGQSLRSIVRVQQLYARERGVPWGISESAYSARDSALNYQYHAFGIPDVGVKRRSNDNLVVAPYASALALMVDRQAATHNLRDMAARGWMGRYGFYEAIDYSSRRVPGPQRYSLVSSFMAHHQGMTLLALANVVLDEPMRRRFHADPLVQATEYLLEERVPLLFTRSPEDKPLPEFEPAAPTVIPVAAPLPLPAPAPAAAPAAAGMATQADTAA